MNTSTVLLTLAGKSNIFVDNVSKVLSSEKYILIDLS